MFAHIFPVISSVLEFFHCFFYPEMSAESIMYLGDKFIFFVRDVEIGKNVI